MFRRDIGKSINKPEGVFRIVVLGDSVAYGQGVPPNDSLPAQLEKLLNLKSKVDIEVVNLAHNGYSIYDYLFRLGFDGIAYKPDLVLLVLSHDDALLERPETPLEHLRAVHSAWAEGSIGQFYMTEAFRGIASKCSTHSIEVFVAFFEAISNEFNRFCSDSVRRHCEQLKLPFYDLLGAVAGELPDISAVVSERDSHPSVAAHRCAAMHLAEILLKTFFAYKTIEASCSATNFHTMSINQLARSANIPVHSVDAELVQLARVFCLWRGNAEWISPVNRKLSKCHPMSIVENSNYLLRNASKAIFVMQANRLATSDERVSPSRFIKASSRIANRDSINDLRAKIKFFLKSLEAASCTVHSRRKHISSLRRMPTIQDSWPILGELEKGFLTISSDLEQSWGRIRQTVTSIDLFCDQLMEQFEVGDLHSGLFDFTSQFCHMMEGVVDAFGRSSSVSTADIIAARKNLWYEDYLTISVTCSVKSSMERRATLQLNVGASNYTEVLCELQNL